MPPLAGFEKFGILKVLIPTLLTLLIALIDRCQYHPRLTFWNLVMNLTSFRSGTLAYQEVSYSQRRNEDILKCFLLN